MPRSSFPRIVWLLLCLITAGSTSAQDRIRVGVSVPQSGSTGPCGNDLKNSLTFANERLAQGGYELVIADDQCGEQQAAEVARKFAETGQIKYVLGLNCGAAQIAAAPIYEQSKIIAIASAVDAPSIAASSSSTFRTAPGSAGAIKLLSEHISKRVSSIGIVSAETAYCRELTKVFQEQNRNRRLSVQIEAVPSNTPDFKPQLQKLRKVGVEALFLNPESENSLITLYRQLLELNWPVPVYAVHYPGAPAFSNAFKRKADGIIYAGLPPAEELFSPAGKALYQDFLAAYGPPSCGDSNVILGLAAFNALHQAVSSGQEVVSYLRSSVFEGVLKPYSFDQNGDIVSRDLVFLLKTIKDGQPVNFELPKPPLLSTATPLPRTVSNTATAKAGLSGGVRTQNLGGSSGQTASRSQAKRAVPPRQKSDPLAVKSAPRQSGDTTRRKPVQ